jgi:outer membrane protein assembly factor BamB
MIVQGWNPMLHPRIGDVEADFELVCDNGQRLTRLFIHRHPLPFLARSESLMFPPRPLSFAKLGRLLSIALIGTFAPALIATEAPTAETWTQWRGPSRDGQVAGPTWPAQLSEDTLKPTWTLPLGPSYSGPIVSADRVFVTETRDKSTEVVRALDRLTGKELWSHSWAGALSVPFYAKSRGDWIRATPATNGKLVFVAGMRDVLVAVDVFTGKEQWSVDFVKKYGTGVPDFGLVCSPLLDGDAIFIQAANSLVKLKQDTGEVVWRSFEGKPGVMSAGSFSSPVLATIHGQRQLVVQSRENLAGIDPESGKVLWSHPVPSYRGMNILTPTVFGDAVFTSSYQNRSWLYSVAKTEGSFNVQESWSNSAQGYMSTPVIIDGHAYLHMGNQRFTCIDLKTGARVWNSDSFGKYSSLVAQGDRILALDERGFLLLIKADPKGFQLLDQRKVAAEDTWAHLAVCGEEIFVRELRAISAFRWQSPKLRADATPNREILRATAGE